MSDLIDRQAALDALGEEPPVWYDGDDEIAERNQWRRDKAAIEAVPPACNESKQQATASSDLIDRHDAIDAIRNIRAITGTFDDEILLIDKAEAQTELMMLPTAQPERKRGKWIERDECWYGIHYECSVCKYSFSSIEGTPSDNDYYFCPSCGSYNGGEERDDDS